MTIEKTAGSRLGNQNLMIAQPEISSVANCRGCGSALISQVGSLGNQYVVDFPEAGKEYKGLQSPLNVMRCESCSLVQLQHTVNPDRLFQRFWYRSGINSQMVAALHDVVNKSVEVVGGLQADDCVADIGSNDGTLLKVYPKSVHTVGFEPCLEMVALAEQERAAEVLFATYFRNGSKLRDLFMGWQQSGFKIITALAMFYDIDTPLDFLRDVEELLDTHGVFVVQMNHLLGMLRNMTFDNISHEHLCYYSLHSLLYLLNHTNLRVRDVEMNDVNGGSLRAYIGHRNTTLRGLQEREGNNIASVLEAERAETTPDILRGFFAHQKEVSSVLSNFIRTVMEMGQEVYVYGASTRGTTLLQTLDENVQKNFVGAAERDERKYGRMMVGSWTSIVPEAEARKKADYFFVLPYHFLPSILERERQWIADGGQLIVPLPNPRVVSRDGVKELL